MNAPSQFDLATPFKPLAPLRKRGGLRLFHDMLGAAIGAKNKPGQGNLPVLRCRGSPPPTVSDSSMRKFDSVMNIESGEDDFAEIDDDEICPIDYSYEYEAHDDDDDAKPLSYRFKSASSFTNRIRHLGCDSKGSSGRKEHEELDGVEVTSPDQPFLTVRPVSSQHQSTEEMASKHAESAQVVTSDSASTILGIRQAASGAIGLGITLNNTPDNRRTLENEDSVLRNTQNRQIFQPPPPDKEVYDDEIPDEDGSDDWTVIDMELEEELEIQLGEELEEETGNTAVVQRQQIQAASGPAVHKTRLARPRIHPLFAAKYQDFFACQTESSEILARA